jgi:hypothetical protein
MKIPIDIPMSRPLMVHPFGSALMEFDYLQYTWIDIVFSLQLAFGLWLVKDPRGFEHMNMLNV